MIDNSLRSWFRADRPPFAVILGSNEIASAVGVYLHRAGFHVVLSHDPLPPVIRRGMAFHDALYDDAADVDGITAIGVDSAVDAIAVMTVPGQVALTCLGLSDLLVIGGIDVLVDARMQKHFVTPDLRHLARITIGLGPGFTVDGNCDVAIETHPVRNGAVIESGDTDAADGVAMTLGGIGRERFVYSEQAGCWRTALDIGTRIYKGMILGYLDSQAILAPIDGNLRGIVRDGSVVPARVKLLEIDPRGRAASWTGIDGRSREIAGATLAAIATRSSRLRARSVLKLVHPT